MTRKILAAATAFLTVGVLDSCHRKPRSAPAASVPPTPRTSIPKKSEARRKTPAVANAATVPPVAAGPSSIPPRSEPAAGGLGEMVSNADREDTSRRIDAALDRAHKNLAVLANRSMTAEQIKNVERVDTLSRQAREAKAANDLVTARSLAERAELLSQDLLKAVK